MTDVLKGTGIGVEYFIIKWTLEKLALGIYITIFIMRSGDLIENEFIIYTVHNIEFSFDVDIHIFCFLINSYILLKSIKIKK